MEEVEEDAEEDDNEEECTEEDTDEDDNEEECTEEEEDANSLHSAMIVTSHHVVLMFLSHPMKM